MSKLIPILFSTPMVKALLEGNKTMTRRKAHIPISDHFGTDIMDWGLSKHPYLENDSWYYNIQTAVDESEKCQLKCKYGKVGDVLWVRETFAYRQDLHGDDVLHYKTEMDKLPCRQNWKPSIFMPKDACRIFLKITSIRVERLHDISEADAIAEGVSLSESGKFYLNYTDERSRVTQFIYNCRTAKESFKTLWTLINGFRDEPYAWFKNPFVWVVSFEKVEKPTE